MASSTPILSPPSATSKSLYFSTNPSSKLISTNFPSQPISVNTSRPLTKLNVSSSSAANKPTLKTPSSKPNDQESIFFDGGAHYGDLLANLILGFTLFWLPLTLAAVSRALFLRYRFTDLRVTVISGLTGQDRSDFSYKVIKDVKVVPRFIGEWGDIIITLKDGTIVDLRSVPKFREISKYVLSMAGKTAVPDVQEAGAKGF
ncbi:hypothetical protein C5167_042431 [Papaver somniferum]|uniref:YdbS-like PH domain-containing protein n=1 Tax=Papaver somniferum TaxID=3469 RepID=A0A4Y7L6G3_PAPSO|nr:uncharacterized protein LOC113317056 [Papaver somniferum]RZC79859.1 hypothetical protein C5167_042431 [Papaver somniferum]